MRQGVSDINTIKSAGVLLPITSLPSDYGIGCLSKEAYDFVDWLCDAGQSYWQILPIGPTGYGNSPYQVFSSYAGSHYLISLEAFTEEGLLTKEECLREDYGCEADSVCYDKISASHLKLLRKAYERADLSNDEKYAKFEKENNRWLSDYALFMALKRYFGGVEWLKWDESIRSREKSAVKKYTVELADEIDFHKFLQYKFYVQWKSLKEYANSKGICIIGDIPIYSALDSADVWVNPELFQTDKNGVPTEVAGCPPDGFSPKGQLWGNPVYNWENHKKTGYKWWIDRIRYAFDLYDVVRIDHFRGFDEYYSIPYGAEDAVDGNWKSGPGADLFKAVERELGKKKFIAEDLGFVTDTVREMRADCGFPGMKVLEFAFDKRDTGSESDYLPHNYEYNCVAYTGTHDNQTVTGWFRGLDDEEKRIVRRYLCDDYTPDDKLYLPFAGLIMRSNARLCIIPIQDYMGIDDRGRINRPSTLGGNWEWRLKKGELNSGLARLVREMTERFGRMRKSDKA